MNKTVLLSLLPTIFKNSIEDKYVNIYTLPIYEKDYKESLIHEGKIKDITDIEFKDNTLYLYILLDNFEEEIKASIDNIEIIG